ncbi:hypothetical protein GOODEAATRI_032835 [Goodea atripinnis]|uniref:Cysteine dioxygenase n=1 Tax=Goodea atripinnis TaxID=208336 RepID=A0ABV0P9N7_9TELE
MRREDDHPHKSHVMLVRFLYTICVGKSSCHLVAWHPTLRFLLMGIWPIEKGGFHRIRNTAQIPNCLEAPFILQNKLKTRGGEMDLWGSLWVCYVLNSIWDR